MAGRLVSSINPVSEAEIEQLWLLEAVRRAEAVDRGSMKRVSAEEVRRQAQALLKCPASSMRQRGLDTFTLDGQSQGVDCTDRQEHHMANTVSELAERGRSLAPEDRVRLMDLLLESLHTSSTGEIEAAWAKEIERRVAAYERGEGKLYPADEVMAEAARIAP